MPNGVVNILPVIEQWMKERLVYDHGLKTGIVHFYKDLSRVNLYRWVDQTFDFEDEELELVVDCLIAAGIGKESEQTKTVYCSCCSS